MNKGKLSNLLRKYGMMHKFDDLRFKIQKWKNREANAKFRKDFPDVPLPPDYLMYESYQMNYHKYYVEGKSSAKMMASYFAKHIELKNIDILDWGCGPGRVIRHMPAVINNGCRFYGTDYNADSIAWCKENLPGIEFNQNRLAGDLPYDSEKFSVIYGHSIFTHLSEELHYEWFVELYRILKVGGIMYLTTQGDNYKVKLDPEELKAYNAGHLVERGKVKEGHRTYSAFHPTAFMHRLFHNVEILDHITFTPTPGAGVPQDIWIIRK